MITRILSISSLLVFLLQPGMRPAAYPLGAPQDRYELIDIDTLFYIENRGLTRILVDLNGYAFKLVVDPTEVHQSVNAFLIPKNGEITINIAAFIQPGEDNYMEVLSQGPSGTDAELIIGDLLVPGQEVAYAIEDLTPLPAQFALLQGYPNPFLDRTTITYHVSENNTNGLSVHLAVYDMVGRRVRTLVDDRRFPGTFTTSWDGRDEQGHSVASGVYLCRFQTGIYQETMRVVRLQ